MKYNTTYAPKVSLKDTIEKTEYVINKITKIIKSRYKILKLIAPSFLEEGSKELLSMTEITRPVTFDISDEYKVGQLFLSHTNWTRTMIKKLKLKDKEGVFTNATVIWRDLKINPISSIIKNELSFQIVFNKVKDIKKIVKEETELLYSIIEDLETEFSKEFELEKNFPKIVSYITAQMLVNEFPNVDKKEREKEMADELKAFILKNPGDRLFSGHIHTYIPQQLYATKNFNQIVMKDFVNSTVLKVASIAQVANGELLSDQLSLNNKSYLKENEFYAGEIKNDYNIIEIKINIGRLMMALLKKGHIAEVQPGNISDEAKIISSRYKVEEY